MPQKEWIYSFTMTQVHFANYSDKEEVLRKSKLLKGGAIHISEDFSRKVFFSRMSIPNIPHKELSSSENEIGCTLAVDAFALKVREHRQELNKFIREIRARDPARHCHQLHTHHENCHYDFCKYSPNSNHYVVAGDWCCAMTSCTWATTCSSTTTSRAGWRGSTTGRWRPAAPPTAA